MRGGSARNPEIQGFSGRGVVDRVGLSFVVYATLDSGASQGEPLSAGEAL